MEQGKLCGFAAPLLRPHEAVIAPPWYAVTAAPVVFERAVVFLRVVAREVTRSMGSETTPVPWIEGCEAAPRPRT